MAVMEDISRRIGQQGGAALLIDYGYWDRAAENIPAFTLQAVQNHQRVHPFHQPGLTDLTSLVNFKALAEVVERTAIVCDLPIHSLPLSNQSTLLRNLGIAARLEQLVNKVETSGEAENVDEETINQQVRDLISAATRLVALDQMGGTFKVMAVIHEKVGQQIAGWEDKQVSHKLQQDQINRKKVKEQITTASNS